MNCNICSSLIENNNCYSCNIRFNKNKSIQDRHCWNIEEYKIYLKEKSLDERRKGFSSTNNNF